MTALRDDEVGREFFHLYRRLPALWKISSEEYKNKTKRKRALNILLEKYKQIDANANLQTMRTKISNVRTCYRREVKRMKASVKRGDQGDNLYTPTLWYYPLLDFLRAQEEENACTELDEDYENSELQNLPDETLLEWAKQTKKSKFEPSTIQPTHSPSFREPTQSPSPRMTDKKRKHHNVSPILEKKPTLVVSAERKVRKRYEDGDDDDVNIYTKYWGCGFRKLSAEQQIFAKKAFEDILLLGQLNRLSFDTVSLLAKQISNPEESQEVEFEKYEHSENESCEEDDNTSLQDHRESPSPKYYSHDEPFEHSYSQQGRRRIPTKVRRGNPLER